MKSNREFIDGIYQKAELYQTTKTKKEKNPFRYRRYLRLPAACALVTCTILGIFLIRNTEFSQKGSNEEINEISYTPNVRTFSLEEPMETNYQVCVKMVEMTDTEMNCVVYNSMGSGFAVGDMIAINISETEYVKFGNRFIATITETGRGYELLTDETTFVYIYEKTVDGTDYYKSESGEEVTLPVNE